LAWTISFTPRARKALAGLDRSAAARIVATLERNLAAFADPRAFGKALAGEKAGFWRYRVGDYRLICRLENDRLVVLVIEAGHRREVYR
jgi:mRNA interferase RelE/StbE